MKHVKEAYEVSDFVIKIGDEHLPLPLFLSSCADSFTNPGNSILNHKEAISFRDRFLDGGINALYKSHTPHNWVQFGLTLMKNDDLFGIHDLLNSFCSGLLKKGVIDNFFFMYKPPGLRIRFNMRPDDRNNFRKALVVHLNNWKKKGILSDFVPGVYEEEAHLFGGNCSMTYVHQLFTIDSLAQLQFHILTAKKEIADADWLLSLVMLRNFFNQLGISGWEDIDVWDRIRQRTFRSLPESMRDSPEFKVTAMEVRAQWQMPYALDSMLSPKARIIVKNYNKRMTPVIAEWRNNYFNTSKAYIGVREAAAFFTIFHWNRAGISFPRQVIMTEALAAREAL